jgi:hypothetical protein
MAIFTPTVITTSSGLSITMAGGVTYQEFLNSLGRDYYRLVGFYISAQSASQINRIISYEIIDADGNIYQEKINIEIDEYQRQNAYVKDLSDRNILLTGLSSISFVVEPNERIVFDMCLQAVKITEGLDKYSPSNYQKVDDKLGNLVLYEKQIWCG